MCCPLSAVHEIVRPVFTRRYEGSAVTPKHYKHSKHTKELRRSLLLPVRAFAARSRSDHFPFRFYTKISFPAPLRKDIFFIFLFKQTESQPRSTLPVKGFPLPVQRIDLPALFRSFCRKVQSLKVKGRPFPVSQIQGHAIMQGGIPAAMANKGKAFA